MYDLDDFEYGEKMGVRLVRIEEAMEKGPKAIMAEARAIVGDGPVYVSFDIDMLDPVYAPGTGTPEVGGFTTFQAQQMLRELRGLNIVGADVVEVSPPFDSSGVTAHAGVTMMFEFCARWQRTWRSAGCRRKPLADGARGLTGWRACGGCGWRKRQTAACSGFRRSAAPGSRSALAGRKVSQCRSSGCASRAGA